MRRKVLLAALGASLLLVTCAVVRRIGHAPLTASSGSPDGAGPSLSRASRIESSDDEPSESDVPAVAGLDLLHVVAADGRTMAPAGGGTAQLTLDPELQRVALGLMS